MTPVSGDKLDLPMNNEELERTSNMLRDEEKACYRLAQTYIENNKSIETLKNDVQLVRLRCNLEFLASHKLIASAG